MTACPELHSVVVGREAMACRFEIVFNAGQHPGDTQAALEALNVVDEIEGRISIYRDDSELSRLNAGGAAGWQPVSAGVFAMLDAAVDLHARTGGGFDIAAGRLVKAWGFLRRQGRTPSPEERAAALAASGTRWLELDRDRQRARFTRPGVEINPGAIGKGWALDRAVERLAVSGIKAALAHGGSSSVRAIGAQGSTTTPEGRRGWPVGIRHPLRPGVRLATVALVDRALGTSGSGTQFFIERGRKIGHILDPRTGLPAEGVLSATVLAPTAAEADALATAAYVLGAGGLPAMAPLGGHIGAVLAVPGKSSEIDLIVWNLDAAALSIDDPRGVRVDWTVP